MAPDDATSPHVVCGDIHVDLVARDDADLASPLKPTTGLGGDFEPTVKLDREGGVTFDCDDRPGHPDVFLGVAHLPVLRFPPRLKLEVERFPLPPLGLDP